MYHSWTVDNYGIGILTDNYCVKSFLIRSFIWFVFSCIRTEYRETQTRNNILFGHFSRSVTIDQSNLCFANFYSTVLFIHNTYRHAIFPGCSGFPLFQIDNIVFFLIRSLDVALKGKQNIFSFLMENMNGRGDMFLCNLLLSIFLGPYAVKYFFINIWVTVSTGEY